VPEKLLGRLTIQDPKTAVSHLSNRFTTRTHQWIAHLVVRCLVLSHIPMHFPSLSLYGPRMVLRFDYLESRLISHDRFQL